MIKLFNAGSAHAQCVFFSLFFQDVNDVVDHTAPDQTVLIIDYGQRNEVILLKEPRDLLLVDDDKADGLRRTLLGFRYTVNQGLPAIVLIREANAASREADRN